MISFECPHCKHLLKAPEAAKGRRAKCKKCSTLLHIPAESLVTIAVPPDHAGSLVPTQDIPVSRDNDESIRCPFCAEYVLAIAKKCKHCGSMLDKNSGGASETEEILADCVANLFRGIESVGGRLKITSKRMLFEPHATNLQKNPAEILMSDIRTVQTRNTLGIVPNGMLVTTKSGVSYKFVVWNRAKLITLIQTKLRDA